MLPRVVTRFFGTTARSAKKILTPLPEQVVEPVPPTIHITEERQYSPFAVGFMGAIGVLVALAAYAEAWISGAKVIVFGDALSPLAERLLERGARHVQVYDVDAARAAEASAASRQKQITYAPLELAGSLLRDGAFGGRTKRQRSEPDARKCQGFSGHVRSCVVLAWGQCLSATIVMFAADRNS